MRIVVCVKQVPDPEVPPSRFRIDAEAKTVLPPSDLPPVISFFDVRACEAAVRLKDQDKTGTTVTIVSVGQVKMYYALKHALAMGADDAYSLQDEAFEGSDSFGTALILASAIKRLGDYDLVLCGRQSSDWEAGQTGTLLAEMLGVPLVTVGSEIHCADGKIRIRRALKDGYEELETQTPCVATIGGEIGLPRLPKAMEIVKAGKKPITVWNAQDLGIDPSQVGRQGAHTEVLKLYIPVREVKCELVEGGSTSELAANLIAKLKQTGAIQN